MPKNVQEGIPLDLLTYILLQKFKKTRKGTLWGQLQNFEKSRTVPKKFKGGLVRHVRRCRFP